MEFNTPSDVENDFKDFLDGQRLDACDVIQSTLSPTEEMDMQIRYLACIVFVVSNGDFSEATVRSLRAKFHTMVLFFFSFCYFFFVLFYFYHFFLFLNE